MKQEGETRRALAMVTMHTLCSQNLGYMPLLTKPRIYAFAYKNLGYIYIYRMVHFPYDKIDFSRFQVIKLPTAQRPSHICPPLKEASQCGKISNVNDQNVPPSYGVWCFGRNFLVLSTCNGTHFLTGKKQNMERPESLGLTFSRT